MGSFAFGLKTVFSHHDGGEPNVALERVDCRLPTGIDQAVDEDDTFLLLRLHQSSQLRTASHQEEAVLQKQDDATEPHTLCLSLDGRSSRLPTTSILHGLLP